MLTNKSNICIHTFYMYYQQSFDPGTCQFIIEVKTMKSKPMKK